MIAHFARAEGLSHPSACGSVSGGASAAASLAVSLACFGARLGCDADIAPVIAGDTGSVRVLASNLDTPTSVALRNGIAWVPEGQFTHLTTFGGDGLPGPFHVRSVSLDGDEGTSIDLPGKDFYPEGIAANLATGDLYIGSVLNGTIVRVRNASTTVEPFLPEGNSVPEEDFRPAVPEVLQRGALGLRVDNARRILWVCDSNIGATPARSGGTLVGINYEDRSVAVRHEMLPEGAICNDILIDPSGAVFFTESVFGGIYRILPEEALVDSIAEPWLQDPALAPAMPGQFGANGIALAGSRMFIANTSAGRLVRIDPNDLDPGSTVTVVTLTEAGVESPVILSGPDGIFALSDTKLLVVENGLGGPEKRLIEIRLDAE